VDSVIKVINKLISDGESFSFDNFCYHDKSSLGKYGEATKPEWVAWKKRVYNLIKKHAAANSAAVGLVEIGDRIQTKEYGPENFSRAKETLLKALELLKEIVQEDLFQELNVEQNSSSSPAFSNRVFIVHGHDSALKTETEQFIQEIGLDPIVLHRKPDEGATVIEKFEKHSDVGYAFVLLTPDEIAYTIIQDKLDDTDREKEKRARPNVIFELGFFVGRLGRNRVCCLHKGDIEIPSDLKGLLHKKVDQSIETIAYAIIKELKAAGYKI